MSNFRLALAACLLVLVSDKVFAQTPRAYNADDLGTLGGPYLFGAAMNNNGDIVGTGTTADGVMHAFRWTRSSGLLEDLGLFGGVASGATGINDSGDILGFSTNQYSDHPFILPAGGTMQPLAGVFQPSRLTANGWFTGMSANSTGLSRRARRSDSGTQHIHRLRHRRQRPRRYGRL